MKKVMDIWSGEEARKDKIKGTINLVPFLLFRLINACNPIAMMFRIIVDFKS